jgi:hypothetical protein
VLIGIYASEAPQHDFSILGVSLNLSPKGSCRFNDLNTKRGLLRKIHITRIPDLDYFITIGLQWAILILITFLGDL